MSAATTKIKSTVIYFANYNFENCCLLLPVRQYFNHNHVVRVMVMVRVRLVRLCPADVST